ncbi:hypothetical protein KC332_g4166 [Hortaea werneckii]|uniref:Dolichyldiphosphatase n=2 Tax=Hortaea werneckii TaxID=91943 RepID=A0A3M7ILN4_HORWE|nr:hypothetical protein KC358_g8363 [Hortaea werneckii]OTA22933.1 hypothetical protein BTJ68_14518 [Hortaea werneckii EXF-2000]KAI6849547.1 hypothetical protein KC350_g2560 [Hortaea werneckii]KAI6928329.1 hypothetical protein KC341_g11589 [Hortaea werneckii]KAI6945798.1 hypothetical protein KC348_g3549 [Hortaea werneckii]
MEDPPLASLSLTHVSYNPSDPFSHLSAYLALVPQALVISYAALIWSTREIEILLMFTGQMGCEAFNWLLKRYIKEERPTQMLGKGYGMPSSHAQFVAFFSTYLTLFLLFRHNPHHHTIHPHRHTKTPLYQRALLALASIGSAAAVAQSRIYLNYHHPRQVYVGLGAGVFCAVGWFTVTSIAHYSGWVEALIDSPPARWLRFRDLVVNEDLVDAGWERWEMIKAKRQQAREQESKKAK